MNEYDIVISEELHWDLFRQKHLDVVVDPMVFRSADVLLRGQQGSEQSLPGRSPDEVWQALSYNLGSLMAFFDQIILSEHLPIIDYGYTFDTQIDFNPHDLYTLCNQIADDPVLVSVHVMEKAYISAREAAIWEMRLRHEHAPVSARLAASINQELSAFDYSWQPDLSPLEPRTQEEEMLSRFLFGGLLFGIYAQKTGAGHLLQPKRSRLFLAASLLTGITLQATEDELFAELKKIEKKTGGKSLAMLELDHLPPFLPYLLSQDPKPRTPTELLERALKLRKSGAVKDYRGWRTQLIMEWRDRGRATKLKDLQRAADGAMREFRLEQQWPIDVKLSVAALGPALEVGASLTQALVGLWGWTVEQVPGRRYSKLLMRMIAAHQEFRKLDRAIRTLWNTA